MSSTCGQVRGIGSARLPWDGQPAAVDRRPSVPGLNRHVLVGWADRPTNGPDQRFRTSPRAMGGTASLRRARTSKNVDCSLDGPRPRASVPVLSGDQNAREGGAHVAVQSPQCLSGSGGRDARAPAVPIDVLTGLAGGPNSAVSWHRSVTARARAAASGRGSSGLRQQRPSGRRAPEAPAETPSHVADTPSALRIRHQCSGSRPGPRHS